jgi:hypothetical protein
MSRSSIERVPLAGICASIINHSNRRYDLSAPDLATYPDGSFTAPDAWAAPVDRVSPALAGGADPREQVLDRECPTCEDLRKHVIVHLIQKLRACRARNRQRRGFLR